MVADSAYIEQKVLIRYEICTKWCTHPFYGANDEWIGTVSASDGMTPQPCAAFA